MPKVTFKIPEITSFYKDRHVLSWGICSRGELEGRSGFELLSSWLLLQWRGNWSNIVVTNMKMWTEKKNSREDSIKYKKNKLTLLVSICVLHCRRTYLFIYLPKSIRWNLNMNITTSLWCISFSTVQTEIFTDNKKQLLAALRHGFLYKRVCGSHGYHGYHWPLLPELSRWDIKKKKERQSIRSNSCALW